MTRPTPADSWQLASQLARRLRWTVGSTAQRLGRHAGRRLGSAGEFEGYRPYEPGDDLAGLDLRAYSRLRQRLVRVHREDSVVPITLLADRSPSALVPTRQRCVAQWLTLLAAIADSAGDPVRRFTFGTGALRPIPEDAADGDTPKNTVPAAAAPSDQRELRSLPPDPHGRGAVILLGDGFGITDPQRELGTLCRVGLPFCFAFLDDEELAPQVEAQPVTLRSREAEAPWSGQITAATIAEYRQHLQRYHQGLQRWLRSQGGDLFVLRTAASIGAQLEQVAAVGSLLR
ncbi:MAG: DUF58 domain-containing protein [Planctomycetota bacterium]